MSLLTEVLAHRRFLAMLAIITATSTFVRNLSFAQNNK